MGKKSRSDEKKILMGSESPSDDKKMIEEPLLGNQKGGFRTMPFILGAVPPHLFIFPFVNTNYVPILAPCVCVCWSGVKNTYIFNENELGFFFYFNNSSIVARFRRAYKCLKNSY